MKAVIISIGDELVTGHIVDTNTAWLAKRIACSGYEIVSHHTVGDSLTLISEIIQDAASRCDLIVVAGGLGPTPDDITRKAVANVLNESLVHDPEALVVMKGRYEKRGITMPPENFIQAQRPESAKMIPNDCGTAPGLILQIGVAVVYVLPGVPDEMKTMWETSVEPDLLQRNKNIDLQVSHEELVHCIGMPESKVGYKLRDLMKRGIQPAVGTLPKDSVVTCRVHSQGHIVEDDIISRVKSVAEIIETRLTPYVFGRGDTTLPDSIVARLSRAGKTCVTVESCTGGMLGAMITRAAGSSSCYLGGWQTYSNQMKIDSVDVDPDIINQYGAVSDMAAKQMAVGAIYKSGADIAISITGIAGPDGGTEIKPVGSVYIALAVKTEEVAVKTNNIIPEPVIIKSFLFPGDRETVRNRAVTSAMAMLHLYMANDGVIPKLTWESDLNI